MDKWKVVNLKQVREIETFRGLKDDVRYGIRMTTNTVPTSRTYVLYAADAGSQQEWDAALTQKHREVTGAAAPAHSGSVVSQEAIDLDDLDEDEKEATYTGQESQDTSAPAVSSSQKRLPRSRLLDDMPERTQTGWRSKFADNNFGSIKQNDDQSVDFDFCLVFDLGDSEKKVKLKKDGVTMSQSERYSRLITSHLRALQTAGLQLSLYRSVQGDELYVLIGATEERLRFEANRTQYDLSLDPERSLEVGTGMKLRLAQKTVDESDERAKYCGPHIWQNLFGKYDKDANPKIYSTFHDLKTGRESLFRPVDRFKLIVSIVEADLESSGAEIAIGDDLDDGDHPALAFFPLHAEEELRGLQDDWKPIHMFNSPIHRVRNYFGEKVAMYFAFLSFYNRALLFPAFLGLIYFAIQMAETGQRVDVNGIWVLGFSMAIWGTVFLEYWKRKEAKLRMVWGMTHFSEKEQTRPEFRGEFIASSVDGSLELYYPWHKKILGLLMSGSVIFTLIACVIASVTGIFLWRADTSDQTTLYLISVVNAIQIQILNFVYSLVSNKLNENENHRTDTEFENALIAKSFLFKFVNSYNSLFYIAFIKAQVEDAGCRATAGDGSDGSSAETVCLIELRTQLAIVFGTMIVLNNLIEISKPYLMKRWSEYQQGKGLSEELQAAKTRAEKQFELAECESTFDDYDELVLQYGFVVLFIVALPVTPLFALFNNFLETMLDSRKYIILSRRPEPRGAANIGTWYDILNVMTVIAVVTNVAMCVLISSSFESSPLSGEDGGRVWIFLIAEHAILLMKFAAEYFVPDVPLDVEEHVARQKYIVAALIDEVPDDDDQVGAVEKLADEATFNYVDEIDVGYEGEPVTFDKIQSKLLSV